MTSSTVEPENAENAGVDENAQARPSYDDVNTPVILMVGAISAILTICSIFFVQGVFYQWKNSYVRVRSYDYVNEPVRKIVEGQKELLVGNAENNVKSIDEAMSEVVKEFGNK